MQNEEITRILLSEAPGIDPDFDEKLVEFYSRLTDLIEGSLKLGQQMGIIKRCNTRITAMCILGTIKEVMYQNIMRKSVAKVEEIAEQILDFTLFGILSPHLRSSTA